MRKILFWIKTFTLWDLWQGLAVTLRYFFKPNVRPVGIWERASAVKAYGAGLLSSFGELEYACSPVRPAQSDGGALRAIDLPLEHAANVSPGSRPPTAPPPADHLTPTPLA